MRTRVNWSLKKPKCLSLTCKTSFPVKPPSNFFHKSSYELQLAANESSSQAMALRTFLFFSILTTTILLSAPLIPAVDFNYPAIFNFGDSNSDTGGLVSAGIGEPLDLPNGATYFHKPSGRFCDGRLIIDFLCNVSSISYTHTFFFGVSLCLLI